eukprot:2305071-Prorocentrum_lima.AAC.1
MVKGDPRSALIVRRIGHASFSLWMWRSSSILTALSRRICTAITKALPTSKSDSTRVNVSGGGIDANTFSSSNRAPWCRSF